MGPGLPDDASELLVRQRAIAHTQNVSGYQSRCYLCYLQSTVSSSQQLNKSAIVQVAAQSLP